MHLKKRIILSLITTGTLITTGILAWFGTSQVFASNHFGGNNFSVFNSKQLNSKQLSCKDMMTQNKIKYEKYQVEKVPMKKDPIGNIGFTIKVAQGWFIAFNGFIGTLLEDLTKDQLLIMPVAGAKLFEKTETPVSTIVEIDGKKAEWKQWSVGCGKTLYGEIKFLTVPPAWNEWHKIQYIVAQDQWSAVKAMIFSIDLWE